MTLMLLFEKTVCVLTTSAPVEHIFTPCERILRPHRAVHIWETRCSLTCRLGVLSAISIFVTTRDIDSFLCYSYWIDYLQYDLNSLLLTALDLILASYVIIVFLALVLRVMSLALAGLGWPWTVCPRLQHFYRYFIYSLKFPVYTRTCMVASYVPVTGIRVHVQQPLQYRTTA